MQNPSDRSPDPDVCAVVVAAGRGSRLGGDQNKLLLPLGSGAREPLLAHTVRALVRGGHVGSLVLVTRPEERDCLLAIARHAAPEDVAILPADGGAERIDSIRNGAFAAPPTAKVLLLHDGARPFVAEATLRAVIEGARSHGGCIPVLPIVDTVKQVEGSTITRSVDRGDLALAQTPQGFMADAFREALERVARPDPRPADSHAQGSPVCGLLTDDASVYEALGRTVHTVPGDPLNLKITRPGDMELAAALAPVFAAREQDRSEEDDR